MKTIIKIASIFFVLLFSAGYTQNEKINYNVFQPGETLIYKVKWTFIRLGTITIKTESIDGNSDYVKISMLVESSPGLFFINIKEYNESIVDVRNCMSVSYYGDFINGSEKTKIFTSYNQTTGTASVKIIDDVNKKEIFSDTIYNSPRYVEGPSLFFFTRALSKAGRTFNVPTMIEGAIENTKIVFTDTKEELTVDAFPEPVLTRKYYGIAEWEGGTSQGMSGDFTGWITADDAAIPVYAEVEVLLGSLKIELEECIRNKTSYKTVKELK
ncbi:MAG: hypothetical protein B6D44_08705 [Ignavibacteriales bacterium UTCHB2]|jgi:hypothetical protein|nr:MAG: hypothetical protein BWY38_01417 [Ignavibacteria bacterium ADurb.Bin266]OQY72984.1 MAG: hypothetical protein B6D44_08705 [Ignavibacteriales bacterium UTCHB2]HQI40362.1 DUF3108 domain-containing protein [Ignavibacteriaceae bacterium]